MLPVIEIGNKKMGDETIKAHVGKIVQKERFELDELILVENGAKQSREIDGNDQKKCSFRGVIKKLSEKKQKFQAKRIY